MIQTFTFGCPLGERDADATVAKLRGVVKHLRKFQHVLRGFTAKPDPDDAMLLLVQLRIAGINRWNIQADAKRLAALILRRGLLDWKKASFVTAVTELNLRDLPLGQGRTPRSKIPRSARQHDGSPWDHIAWWGDDLSDYPS